MRRKFIIVLLLVDLLFFLGVALSMTVGMRNEDTGPLGLVRNLLTLDEGEFFAEILSARYVVFVAVMVVSIIPFIVRRLRRFESAAIGLALCALFVPILYQLTFSGEGEKLLAVVVLMPLLALATPFIMLAGLADGEFYSEGFVLIGAAGWWMIVWGIAAIAKFGSSRRSLASPLRLT